jgi:hypothetical protein
VDLIWSLFLSGGRYLSGVWWLGVKIGYQEDTCCNEIRLCAQNIDIILGLLVNPIGRAYAIV